MRAKMLNELIETQTTTCGRFFMSKANDMDFQVHCHYKLYYIVDGFFDYKDSETVKRMVPGCVYLLPDRRLYSLSIPEEFPDMVTEAILFFIISQPNLCESIVEFNAQDYPSIQEILPAVISIADDCGIGKGENRFSRIMQNTVNIFFNILDIEKPFSRVFDESILKSIEFIKENLSADLSNDVLAKVALMSKSNFIKKFTHQVKKTPQKYVLDIRMTKALKLLNEGHKTREICDLVGYESVSSFNRAYKTLFNRTPSECVYNLYRYWK
jgi:AraC-like DNA-binding protein